MQQLLIAHIEFDHPPQVSGAVDVDVMAVETQLLAGLMVQLYLHLDLDVTAAQDKAQLVLFVVIAHPVVRPD